jgi:DNA-directed RNA polymerase subunit RPC12/RpoP
MNKEEQKPRAKDMVIYCVKCDARLQLEPNQEEVLCPECGSKWSVRWLAPDLPLPQRRILTNT